MRDDLGMADTTSRWCPNCGAEYLPEVETCADCGVALAEGPPPPADHETVAYDFADADAERRLAVEMLLHGAGIPFGWDGDDLVVPHVAEAQVDALLAEQEVLEETGEAGEAGPAGDVPPEGAG